MLYKISGLISRRLNIPTHHMFSSELNKIEMLLLKWGVERDVIIMLWFIVLSNK